MDGICTLANDRVYDQLIALLNSIEVILGQETPVCVYPYDENITKITAEIARRPNVHLYDDKSSIARWDEFFRSAWDTHPTARQRWSERGSAPYHRFGTHRRYCAFDDPFERFIYMDSDTLVMSPFTLIFEQLQEKDWVVYDFQHTDISHVYDVSSPKLTEVFPTERLNHEIFCSGFYASKQGLFDRDRTNWILERLRAGEAEILYIWSADQPLLNYMVMRTDIPSVNLAFSLPPNRVTGCCITSSHFQEKDNILYDKGNRLTYIHYIGLPSQLFTKVCTGENIVFPYRDLFLHYRYLYEPEKRPKFRDKPRLYNQPPSLKTKLLRKLGLTQ